ncbi:hypothetical protein [Bradyrhizobium sp. SZCCHNS3053]|uniref:hypothetical protein n=1 Tax=Bradyrhizobium sp. SZCCHNS3053 TaxID=3057322 RepID=UPI00291671F5|nr:hypothetical protein [Bradyrhizobium sp. SZCCHNS3053]
MSEKLLHMFLQANPIETEVGAAMRVMMLFNEIEKVHGAECAKALFERWALKPSQREINKLKGWKILERLDRMTPPNKAKLAREIVEENMSLPDDQQVTPRLRPTYSSLYDYIRTLERERKEGIADGTWRGPRPLPDWSDWSDWTDEL